MSFIITDKILVLEVYVSYSGGSHIHTWAIVAEVMYIHEMKKRRS
jgi:hypothetical protein